MHPALSERWPAAAGSRLAAACVLLLLALDVQMAGAQVVSVGASAAPVFQIGTVDTGQTLETGWHVGLGARVDPRTKHIGVQADVGIASSAFAPGSGSGRLDVWEAGLAAFYRIGASTALVRPYAIAGAGVYYVEEPGRNTITPALNVGAGVEVGRKTLRAFSEARYTYVFTWGTNLTYVPLSVGLRYALNP